MNEQSNPYRPPEADIDPPSSTTTAGTLLDQPRSVAASQGASWVGSGWELMKGAMGTWILMFIVSSAIIIVLSFIPLLGLLSGFLMPIFIGGWMIGCHRMHEDGEVRFEDLFAGFAEHFAPLAIASLLYTVANIVVMMAGGIVVAILGGSLTYMFDGDPGGGALSVGLLLGMLVMLALMLPLMMMIWFAPALITQHRISPVDALRMSFVGCLRNILPFLLYGLVGLLLFIVGLIPLGLGLLIVYPLLTCATYSAYRDIFLARGD
jgi:hypothetical protein